MNAKTQTTNDAPRETFTKKTEVPETAAAIAMLMHRNFERLANLQKATLEALGQQTADVTETVRTSLKWASATPAAAYWFEVAGNGMEGWIGAQKNILDLMVEQSAYSAQVTAERVGYAAQSIHKLGELVQQSFERTTTAQKTILDFAAKQNDAMAHAFARPVSGPVAAPVAEIAQSMHHGLATLIDKQKEFVDAAGKMAKEAAATKS
jgi:hypothetical protein